MDPSPPWVCRFCGTPHEGAATDSMGRPRIPLTDDGLLSFLRTRLTGVDGASLHPTIPAKQLASVRKVHPYLPPNETILAVYDGTVFGSASDGFYITARRIGYKNQMESPQFLEWSQVDDEAVYSDDNEIYLGQAKIETVYEDDADELDTWVDVISSIACSAKPPGHVSAAAAQVASGGAASAAVAHVPLGPGWNSAHSAWPPQPTLDRPEYVEQLLQAPYQADTGCSRVDVSAAGNMIVAAGGSVMEIRYSNGAPHLAAAAPDSVLAVRFSPDGQYLLCGCTDQRASLFDVRTGALRGKTPEMEDYCDDVVWLGAGPRFAAASQRGELWIIDGMTMQPTLRILGPDPEHDSLGGIAATPDGNTVFISLGERLGAFDTTTGRLCWRFDGALRNASHIAVSPRGDVLVAAGYDGVALFDARTGQPGMRFPLPGATTVSWPEGGGGLFKKADRNEWSWTPRPRFSPAGDLVALQDHAGNLAFLDTTTYALHPTPRVMGRAWIEDIAWMPDSNHVVLGASDNTLAIWRVRPPQGLLHIQAIRSPG
jgi:WD40 repeat protein